MSKTNQISGVDTLGYEWHAACGDALEPEARADGSVAMLNFQDDGGHFSDKEAAKLATFLLAAVGPDAARKALAKLALGYEIGECVGCQKETLVAPTGAAGAVSICLPCLETSAQETLAKERARAALAEKRLAAVLALTPEDILRTFANRKGVETGVRTDTAVEYAYECEGCGAWSGSPSAPCDNYECIKVGANGILNLIHSRATEGAEVLTGATT